ncbi:MAG: transporter substrate-binding domain-containing protein [Burkholderiales bacterium]
MVRTTLRTVVVAAVLWGNAAYGQINMNSEIAVTGKFRVGMNGNNGTLTIRNSNGSLAGLSVDLGRFIAGKLGVPFEPVFYANSSPFTKSFGSQDWDIVITGKNSVVAKLVDFSSDLFLIEYVYLAAPGREFADVSVVDRPGVRIAVPRNASADVYLTRALKSAELVRLDGDANDAIEFLRAGQADVYGSGINTLRPMVERLPGSKIVGAFNIVTFSVAMRPGLSAEARTQLTQWVEEAKAAGIVQKGLVQAGAKGVRVAQ